MLIFRGLSADICLLKCLTFKYVPKFFPTLNTKIEDGYFEKIISEVSELSSFFGDCFKARFLIRGKLRVLEGFEEFKILKGESEDEHILVILWVFFTL